MLFQITEDTKIEDLIIAGASVDGKISQQTTFIKYGLGTPTTFFFNSDIAKVENNKIILHKNFYAQVIEPFENIPYQYQLRTENTKESLFFVDVFSESRVGLTKSNLEENLIGILSKDNHQIKKIVGIIQILPPKSLDRNLVSGLAQIISINKKPHFYFSLHRGIASYLNRTPTVDAILNIPLNKIQEISNLDLSPYITVKSKSQIITHVALNLKRFGITALTKDLEPLRLATPLKLPFNFKENRIKKEYELTDIELLSQNYPSQIKHFKKLVGLFRKDPLVQYISTELDLHLTEDMNLETLLICAGALYISIKNDKYNSTRNEILDLISGKSPRELFDLTILKSVISDIFKLGIDNLTTHLVSFSVVTNEITNTPDLILWDMPLDKALSITSQHSIPKDLLWISTPTQDLSKLKGKQAVGINLKVSDDTNADLIITLKRLKSYPNIKDVYVKYALLSHLATIIREHNFNVISI